MTACHRLPDAQRDASDLLRLLDPACERIAIAGSVRREAELVRDIDLVLVPRLVAPAGLLFDGEPVSILDDLIARSIAQPSARLERPRDAKNGPRHKELRFRGRKVELWIVLPPATWGVIFALRTGPADFGHLLVTAACLGGALPAGCRIAGGQLWRGDEAVPTPEESDLFDALDLPTMPPGERSGVALRRLLRERNHPVAL